MCQKISGSKTAADSYTITDAYKDCKRFRVLLLPFLDIKYEIVKVLFFCSSYNCSLLTGCTFLFSTDGNSI